VLQATLGRGGLPLPAPAATPTGGSLRALTASTSSSFLLNETGANRLNASELASLPPLQPVQDDQVVNPKDGNTVLIDDDGVGYIAYTAIKPRRASHPGESHPPGFKGDHMVAIERLTPDLRHSTKVRVGHLFPLPDDILVLRAKGVYQGSRLHLLDTPQIWGRRRCEAVRSVCEQLDP
jgi:hypothetical protein